MKTTVKQKTFRLSSLLLCVLIAVMALTFFGCGDKASSSAPSAQSSKNSVKQLGTGQYYFNFTATDLDGTSKNFEIHTNQKTVGSALQELELISGEEGAFGIYVKEVCGITADFDTDKTYWSFYVDGEYATKGVSETQIENGEQYAFIREK